MNDQLPPIDADLREQLARRSAGGLPVGLASEVFTALDSAPVMRPIWRVPRLAVAGVSLALVVVMVAAIALSVVHTAPAASPISPAGYPAERALTAAELASLMAGPALPVNTALVASVAIEVHNDVCPMNRYPTVGVIAGIGSQVCVVGDATLAAEISNTTMSGTYAFRYLAPGVLGLLGQITPASSRLAFKVTDEWPLPSAIFLVQGWLGADKLAESCFLWPASDDVLGPAGNNCPFEDWLGDEATAPGISNDYVSHQGSPSPSYDLLSLRGNARHVGAGGMRTIDSIDSQTPVRGTFVVSGANGPCPGAAPQENRGCTTWLVLAKLADITLPAPNASLPHGSPAATASSAPPATPVIGSYPNDRPLTTAELGRAMVAGLPAGQVVVVQASFAQTNGCSSVSRYAPIGMLAGLSGDICVVGIGDGIANHMPADTSGVFAFRVLDGRTLGFMATIDPPGANRTTFQANESWPPGQTILVSGWLVAGSRVYHCGNMGALTPEPLDPGGVPCGDYWISPQHVTSPVATAAPGSGFRQIALPDFPEIGGGLLPQADSAAVYLVRDENRCQSGAVATDSSVNTTWDKLCGWQIMARIDPVMVPAGTSATPAPPPTPAGSSALQPTGLIGPGNRALAVAELTSLVSADPAGLVGSAAIVEGPVPLGTCQKLESSILCPDPQSSMTADGTFAIRVGIGRQLSLIGQGLIEVRPDGIVWTLPQVIAAKSSGLFVVDAWLDWEDGCDAPSDPPYGTGGCGSSLLTAEKLDWMHMASLLPPNAVVTWVQSDGYRQFGSHALSSGAIHGVYLVGVVPGATPTIIARLEPAVLP